MITNMTELSIWWKYSFVGRKIRALNDAPDAINSIALIIAMISFIPLLFIGMVGMFVGWGLSLIVLSWGLLRVWQQKRAYDQAIREYNQRNNRTLKL